MAKDEARPIDSKALEVNIACSQVQVEVDESYHLLHEIMAQYQGIREGLQSFLEEICHPFRNWSYIVNEARNYALNYLHVLTSHPKGPEGVRIYLNIFMEALKEADDPETKSKAANSLFLFVQRLLEKTHNDQRPYMTVLAQVFHEINELPDSLLFILIRSRYRLDRIARLILERGEDGIQQTALLLFHFHSFTYHYWLNQPDPPKAFQSDLGLDSLPKDVEAIFSPFSHRRITELLQDLDEISPLLDADPPSALEQLVEMPAYGDFVDYYARLPKLLFEVRKGSREAHLGRLVCLLRVLGIEGLSPIHEEALRHLNRALRWIIEHEPLEVSKDYLEQTFRVLRVSVAKYKSTTLNCVLNMGRAVYNTEESDLVDFFIDLVVSLGFQAPEIQGVGEDWQIRANQAHIQNIRTWLELIELKPVWSKKLISSLIIHLALGGVLIKDTDIFPRDITALLNSPIAPVFNLIKQLARLFPAYFNEIGAEGQLRDISTEIDEICLRRDPLVHFLRKQSHVESSNRIVELMEGLLEFWRTKDKRYVKEHVPGSIYEQIETQGEHIDGVHRLLKELCEKNGIRQVRDLLQLDDVQIEVSGTESREVSLLDKDRVKMALLLYKLLYQKYHLAFTDIKSYLIQARVAGLPGIDQLEMALNKEDSYEKALALLSYMENLKAMILADTHYQIREDIYRKRHFTVDIPSMYGRYHEPKFDALGLMFRLEKVVNVLFEEMVESLDLQLVTRATITKIFHYLKLFNNALILDGIQSTEMDRQLDLLAHSLEIRGFSFTQYLDIFRGLGRAVSNIVNDYFNNIHEANLQRILEQIPPETILPKYRSKESIPDQEKFNHQVTERFLRERIASSLGLQQLDRLLSKILETLYRQADRLSTSDLYKLLNYDPKRALTPIYHAKSEVSDLIHLGNKGLNLVRMANYGMPVPPGFIITTEVFRCHEIIREYGPARMNFRQTVGAALKELERNTGKRLGHHNSPLLLSVRSGSSISQPGMMNTFLNVGINEGVVEGLMAKTSNPWYAWDTYRRFLQAYGMGFGIERDKFDAIIAEYKYRLGVEFKRDFTGNQMKEVALAYETLLHDHGVELVKDPLDQLYIAISKVFDSWFSTKAISYRNIMGISDDWGTAVTVQAMVFGNFSNYSGSGVFFTHNPRWSGDMILLWGDFTLGNQGEDVVSGLVRTLPISSRQAEMENRDPESSLEIMFPEIYQDLRKWAKKLIYDEGWSPQEMEFTFEGPGSRNLYLLQTRDMFMRERKKTYSFEEAYRDERNFLGHGIGVGGGAMSGRIVFSVEEIRYWRQREPHTSLILIRNDTVPDDIKEIYEADGLLTARGGSTSHAAIVAHRLGKTCVVGYSPLLCDEREKTCFIKGIKLKSGDWISIDGTEGSVYKGYIKVKKVEI